MRAFIFTQFIFRFKSGLRDSPCYLLKKFSLNINLELILHNISRGHKEIKENVQTSISNQDIIRKNKKVVGNEIQ